MILPGRPHRHEVPVVAVEGQSALAGRVDRHRPVPIPDVEDLAVRGHHHLAERLYTEPRAVDGERIATRGRRTRVEDPAQPRHTADGMLEAHHVGPAPGPPRAGRT